MTGRPQTILELLRAITGWSNEDIVRAFGKRESERIIRDARYETLEAITARLTSKAGRPNTAEQKKGREVS